MKTQGALTIEEDNLVFVLPDGARVTFTAEEAAEFSLATIRGALQIVIARAARAETALAEVNVLLDEIEGKMKAEQERRRGRLLAKVEKVGAHFRARVFGGKEESMAFLGELCLNEADLETLKRSMRVEGP